VATSDYKHFNEQRLCRLLMQTEEIEADFRERVASRAIRMAASGDDTLAGGSDPVRKRLAFLLRKWERQRHDAKSELATRGDIECSQENA